MKARKYLDRTSLPPHWVKILDYVQMVEPKALIAGGSLRDFDMGFTPKDLDIFVPYDVDMKAVKGVLKDLYGHWEDGVEYFFQANAPLQVFKAMPEDLQELPKLEIIRCVEGVEPADRWPTFDFGACQIAFDGKLVHTSGQYLLDTDQNEFTLCECDSVDGFWRSMERVRRWQAREYADWVLVIPAKFMPYMQKEEDDDTIS